MRYTEHKFSPLGLERRTVNVEVISRNRKSAVLTPSQLPCLADVPSVNLTLGCAHGFVYCYRRSYSLFPGEGQVAVYADTADRLIAELRRKRRKPTHVYFSPSTDVFQRAGLSEEQICAGITAAR